MYMMSIELTYIMVCLCFRWIMNERSRTITHRHTLSSLHGDCQHGLHQECQHGLQQCRRHMAPMYTSTFTTTFSTANNGKQSGQQLSAVGLLVTWTIRIKTLLLYLEAGEVEHIKASPFLNRRFYVLNTGTWLPEHLILEELKYITNKAIWDF